MLRFVLSMVCLLLPLISSATTFYVNGSSGADGNSGTSLSSAKKTIQAAVNSASSGDTILVSAGTYRENVAWSDKQLELLTIGVLDVTIDGVQSGSCIKLESGATGSIIDGFILYNGAPINSGNKYGGGICCNATATIKNCVFKSNGNTSQEFSGGLQVGADAIIVYNCLFVDNTVYASGGAVLCEGNGTLDRCTIYGNTCTRYDKIGGIAVASGGSATVKNSIIWGNSTSSIGSFSAGGGGTYSVSYSCVEGGCNGAGNISSNPSFADTTRYFALNSGSPCINAGEPSSTDPDGSRGDMGFSISLIRRNSAGDTGSGDNPEPSNDGPRVTNVTAKQRYPWNGMVDITCTVSGISGTAQNLEFSVAAVNSGNVHDISQFWVIKNGTNSTDRAVRANGTYHLVWDSKSDFDNQICSNMVMRVNLVIIHDKVQLWENGPYWATTNIGAEEPWESGYYFWWGDTVGYKRENNAWVATDGSSLNFLFSMFNDSNIPTYGESIDTMKSEGWITAAGVLAPAHDAAHVHWGSAWRMPTKQEFSDLVDKCDWTLTTMNGAQGYVVKGKGTYASARIFLPAAGRGGGPSLDYAGSDGYYWSSVPDSGLILAWSLYFTSGGHNTRSDNNRYVGQSVRPVQGFTE